jgi:hypothetical protein
MLLNIIKCVNLKNNDLLLLHKNYLKLLRTGNKTKGTKVKINFIVG